MLVQQKSDPIINIPHLYVVKTLKFNVSLKLINVLKKKSLISIN
jgi:hypothetical protein